ncbi:type VII secretion-associated serine protease mycosin [Kitasatospora sp. NPDC057223]|uniref:type VII secretion-associated serine protease mycosin n=1 Tax=Kitasatospora sp. NPDC057223 TaxID=3346055 RepID=UPI003632B5C3
MSAPPKAPRPWPVAVALAAVLVGFAPTAAQATETVRSAEWPLDADHFDAEKIWVVTKGEGVTVAVVDSGVAASHPDLAGQVGPGSSLLGDDGDGRADTSPESHGTAVAGIIAASGGPDHTGMTGLAPAARILPVRVSTGEAVTPSLLARGITWAVDHGAQVINVSMGTPQPDALLHQAVLYAIRKDVVVVASAGNSGNTDNLPQYPAAYPGVVSVAGTNRDGTSWAKGQSGRGIVLAAPAADVYSTNDQDAYVNADGTSYSAAYVSAAAALVRSRFPALTAGQVIRRLTDTAAHHHATPDARSGYGTVDPLRALTDPAPAAADRDNPLLAVPAAGGSASRWSSLLPWTITVCAAAALSAAAFVLRRRRRAGAPPAAAPPQPRTRTNPGGAARRPGKPTKGRSRR